MAAADALPARQRLTGKTTPFDLLLILRGLAAVAVVVWHAEGFKGTWPAAINTPGRTAVWIFFGISGYVIAYGFVHRRYTLTPAGLRHFFVNRFLRIYPLFLLLSLLALATLWIKTGSAPIGIADVPAQFFGVQFNHNYLLSGVFWTLGIELQFYLLAPVLVVPLLLSTRASIAVALAVYVLMVSGYAFAVATFGWSYDGRNIVANLPHFFAGMAASRLVASGRRVLPASASLAAAVGLVCLTSWFYHRSPGLFWSATGLVLVDIAILCFCLTHAALVQRPVRRTTILAGSTLLGTLSYGIYGWHAYLAMVAPVVLDHVVLLLVLSTAAAYGSYRLIERPALRLKRYPADSPVAPAAAIMPPPRRQES